MARDKNTILMEGVRIIFRNFEGKETRYNKKGSRNFGVILPDDAPVETMIADEWNVKWLEPREDYEETERVAWLPVEVGYDRGRPPRVVMITSRGRTTLSEETVGLLDGAEILNIDMIIRPRYWEDANGKTLIKAYLQSMYVTIEEDELELKYADLPSQ